MKRVFSNESLVDAGHIRALLEQHGIPCFIKNEQLSGALGEVPFLECMPEVWVYNDSDEARATKLVSEMNSAASDGAPWTCRQCEEVNEPQFSACWKCEASDSVE